VNASSPRRPRRWLRFGLVALAVVVVLAVGGPFVYIHFIEGKAPAKFTLQPSSGSSAGTGTAPGSIDGTWNVAGGSQVGYRVGEVLFGQDNTAVGRTSEVTGRIVISGTTVSSGEFTVAMSTVASDESQRDNQFRGRIMDTSEYPTAALKLTGPIALGSVPAEGVVRAASAPGDLTLRGQTHAVTIPLQTERIGDRIEVQGSVGIVFAKWGIPNPSFGPITTDNHGVLEFLLSFARGSASTSTTTSPPTTAGGPGPGGGTGGAGGSGGGFAGDSGGVSQGGSSTPLTTVPPLTLPKGS
jgi:polyisoprenoid-binding protein YceI